MCIKIHLEFNRLTEIRRDMWKGLDALQLLSLDNNRIAHVHPFALADLRNIRGLYMENNRLKTLYQNSFPVSPGAPLELDLTGNGLNPKDPRLCWIKDWKNKGWIKWLKLQRHEQNTDLECGGTKSPNDNTISIHLGEDIASEAVVLMQIS